MREVLLREFSSDGVAGGLVRERGNPTAARAALYVDSMHKATLFLDDDDDVRVREVPITVAADGSFSVKTAGPKTAGTRMVQLMVERSAPVDGQQAWSESLAPLPIFVDVPEPAAPGPMVTSPPPSPADRTTWQR